MKQVLIFIVLFFSFHFCLAQVNFRAGLEKSDPAPKDRIAEPLDRFVIHSKFLNNAMESQDTLKMIYGNLHLFLDKVREVSYEAATDYIFEAIRLAEESKNEGWKGWTNYRSGMLYSRTNKEEEALDAYEKGAKFCAMAGDSLCMGEALEQLSSFNALLGNYQIADSFFALGMPLLRRHGENKSIATATGNHASFLSFRGKPSSAIPFFLEAIELHKKDGNLRSEGKARNNMADAYRRLEDFDTAIETYEQVIAFNQTHGFSDNLVRNYMGLHLCYDALKEYELSNKYLLLRYQLRDSLIDIRTTEKINELQIKYETKETEAALERSRSELLASRTTNERILFFIVLLATTLGFLTWRIFAVSRHSRITQEQNIANLKGTTKLLIEKNSQLKILEDEVTLVRKSQGSLDENSDPSLFEKNILTADDWSEFKLSFEKSYPSYIMNIRKKFPSMTEGEERLFLMIKLNLTTKETASILGISSESVKKNRYRLRKRLELKSEDSLEQYISQFSMKR